MSSHMVYKKIHQNWMKTALKSEKNLNKIVYILKDLGNILGLLFVLSVLI